MHSSVTTVFRVVVMLSCLIAIPAVAICGRSLPATLRGLIEWGRRPQAVSVFEGPVDETSASAGPLKLDEVPSLAILPARLPEVGYRVPLSPTGESAEASDQLTHAEQRLRQLGATHYRLETWGGQQQLFRFCCRVAIAGSPHYTRYFEATDAQPLVAMNEVLAEVEAWR